jgi:hypothetical protein
MIPVATPRACFAAGAMILALMTVTPAEATVRLSGAGVWGHQTVVTPVGAPDASWSFSFLLPDTIAENPTFEATDFVYSLGGIALDTTLEDIEFFPSGAGGLFDLVFTLDGEERRLELGGPLTDDEGGLDRPDVGSNLTLLLGTFDAELDSVEPTITLGVGVGTVTLSAVPEPTSWALMIVGFGMAGGLLRRRWHAPQRV